MYAADKFIAEQPVNNLGHYDCEAEKRFKKKKTRCMGKKRETRGCVIRELYISGETICWKLARYYDDGLVWL